MNLEKMSFDERLRVLMELKEISCVEMARRTGFNKHTINAWVNGRQEPRFITAITKLAEVLEVSTDALLGVQQEKEAK